MEENVIGASEIPATKGKCEILKELFFSTLYLSTFTFGGGYVIVTMLKRKFVDELHWIDGEEMLDLVAIAQSSPGAIAVNGAIVVGYKLAGIAGVFVSVIGAVIPPFVILTMISLFYDTFRNNFFVKAMLNGMTSGIGAVIVSTTWDMAAGIVKSHDIVAMIIMIAAFILNYFLDVNVIFIILGTAAFGIMLTWIRTKKEN